VPRKRRLQGIAALSVVTLATAGFSGVATAADECADAACADEQINLTDLLQAFGGDEIPEDALIKLADVYEQLGVVDLADAFAKVEYDGSNPEEAFAKLTDVYEQLGMVDLADAFAKVEYDGSNPEEAFPKVEIDLGELKGLEDLFLKLGTADTQDALPMIEEVLLALGDSGEVDPAMLEMFLAMFAEDE